MFELGKKVSGNVNDFCKEARGDIEVAAFGKYYALYYRVFHYIYCLFDMKIDLLILILQT